MKGVTDDDKRDVAIVLALGMPADIYIIDEPSAYLDSEQRIIASRVIKRFIMHAKKTAFVRRDPSTYRPRINKLHSVKDAEQKAAGSYYFLEEES